MTNQQGAPEALRFTKKPVTIEAIQWTGKNLREVITFTDGPPGPPDTRSTHAGMAWEAYADLVARDGLKIYTLEGKMLANPGDWIIRGVKGEYYPCKPDIFEATYSPAALVEAQQPAPTPQADSQPAGVTLNDAIEIAKSLGVREYGPNTRNWSFEYSQLAQFVALLTAAAYVDADRTARAPADSVTAPAATVIKKGADRQWMSERLGHLPDGIYSLYLAPPAQAADSVLEDAARYRWLRNPTTDVALVLDKRTGYVPVDERVPSVGGYYTYEYRSGDELDAAVDAARKQGGAT